MIHIRCVKCGWRVPFLGENDGVIKLPLVCNGCGCTLIENKRRLKNDLSKM